MDILKLAIRRTKMTARTGWCGLPAHVHTVCKAHVALCYKQTTINKINI